MLGHGKGQHHAGFIAQAQADAGNAALGEPAGQRRGVKKFGLAAGIVADADVGKRYRAAYARAHGFGKGFFGGEAFGQKIGRVGSLRPLGQLGGVEQAAGEGFAEFLMQPADAFHRNQVCADAVNHGVFLRKGRLKTGLVVQDDFGNEFAADIGQNQADKADNRPHGRFFAAPGGGQVFQQQRAVNQPR